MKVKVIGIIENNYVTGIKYGEVEISVTATEVSDAKTAYKALKRTQNSIRKSAMNRTQHK